jgi:selenium metabolism protein YedF
MADLLTIDARGLACPQPVLETKRVLDEGLSQQFVVLVDTLTSRENVSRFARNQGCQVEVREDRGEQYQISISCGVAEPAHEHREELIACAVPQEAPETRIAVYVGTDCMGKGDEALGRKLMRGFLRTWIDMPAKPWRMIFINSGVRLTTIDEEAVEAVSLLAEKGVEILSCGTCLEHFGLADRLQAGRATNMFEVIETLNSAAKVISPD